MSQTFFSQAQLTKLVSDVLPPVDRDHTIAVVGTIDREGAQVVANFTRLDARGAWTLQAAYRHEWSGHDEVAARLIFSGCPYGE